MLSCHASRQRDACVRGRDGTAAEHSPKARKPGSGHESPSLPRVENPGSEILIVYIPSIKSFYMPFAEHPAPTKAVYTSSRKLHYENVEVGHPQITALTFRYNRLRRVGQIKDGAERVPPNEKHLQIWKA